MSPSRVLEASGFRVTASGEPQKMGGIEVLEGRLADFTDDDGSPLACVVGPTRDAPVVHLAILKDGPRRRALVVLGLADPATARAVVFRLLKSPADYSRMTTMASTAYQRLLKAAPSDTVAPDGFEDEDETDDDADSASE